jgi:L,D-peptidoglycan transpeptidase YkuD (ErfK/YbiS/YcfS/YnhG family)
MELVIHPDGIAHWRRRELRCAIGRSGVSSNKTEGDGATPVGTFGLRKVLYRADRVTRPETILPVEVIGPADGWCDSPDDADYNRQITLPHDAPGETLWRADAVYDVIAVTTYNEAPVIAGSGSAIFLHVARDGFAATEGCVAFSQADLRAILAAWGPADTVRVCES